MVVEIAHNNEHRNDRHCTEQNSKHFHKAEHHCFICDFVPVVSDKPLSSNQIIADEIVASATFTFAQTLVVKKHNYNFSLRAPPTIS